MRGTKRPFVGRVPLHLGQDAPVCSIRGALKYNQWVAWVQKAHVGLGRGEGTASLRKQDGLLSLCKYRVAFTKRAGGSERIQ